MTPEPLVSGGKTMSQDVSRWLAEVRTLQQQLAAARQERDQAYASATNWRQLYDAEAQQRRTDVAHLDMTVKTLRAEVSALRGQLQTGGQGGPASSPALPDLTARDAPTDLTTVEGLQRELTRALQQCDRLQQQLDAERAQHEQTRQTLTAALGETIDALKQEGGYGGNASLVARPPSDP
jgi:chromosome segregation ATPase